MTEGNEKGSRRKKPLPATYEPDKRTAAWLKLKKDYVNGIGDSIDLVPIGAWYGNGRKVKWWSPILMGLYDPISGRFVAVCKCMSGKYCQYFLSNGRLSDVDRLHGQILSGSSAQPLSGNSFLRIVKELRERYTPSDEDGTSCSARPLWDCDFGGKCWFFYLAGFLTQHVCRL